MWSIDPPDYLKEKKLLVGNKSREKDMGDWFLII